MATLYSETLPPESIEEARERALDLRDMLIEIDAKLDDAQCDEDDDPSLKDNLVYRSWKIRTKDAKFHYSREFKYLMDWIQTMGRSEVRVEEGQNDAVTLLLVTYHQLTEIGERTTFSNENILLLGAIKSLLELEGVVVEIKRKNGISMPSPAKDSGNMLQAVQTSH